MDYLSCRQTGRQHQDKFNLTFHDFVNRSYDRDNGESLESRILKSRTDNQTIVRHFQWKFSKLVIKIKIKKKKKIEKTAWQRETLINVTREIWDCMKTRKHRVEGEMSNSSFARFPWISKLNSQKLRRRIPLLLADSSGFIERVSFERISNFTLTTTLPCCVTESCRYTRAQVHCCYLTLVPGRSSSS